MMGDTKSTVASVTVRNNRDDDDKKVHEIESILLNPEGIDLWKLREACLSEGGLAHGK